MLPVARPSSLVAAQRCAHTGQGCAGRRGKRAGCINVVPAAALAASGHTAAAAAAAKHAADTLAAASCTSTPVFWSPRPPFDLLHPQILCDAVTSKAAAAHAATMSRLLPHHIFCYILSFDAVTGLYSCLTTFADTPLFLCAVAGQAAEGHWASQQPGAQHQKLRPTLRPLLRQGGAGLGAQQHQQQQQQQPQQSGAAPHESCAWRASHHGAAVSSRQYK